MAAAHAETCSLELKRLSERGSPGDYGYRNTYPQSIYMQWAAEGSKTAVRFAQPGELATFRRIVKKEPAYESAHPLRGVIKLGSREYAFALDAVSPNPTPAKETLPTKESPQARKTAGKKDEKKPDRKKEEAAKAQPTAIAYNRLYFDFNGNGDLTDDKVIKADERQDGRYASAGRSFASFAFPRVDVTIDVAGKPLEYSFFLRGYTNVSRDFCWANAQVNAAAYREGYLTIGGKKRHVVLLDFNSNGCFSDQIRIATDIRTADGRLYPQQGDMLKIEGEAAKPGRDFPYDIAGSKTWNHVSKLVSVDGHFYDVEISPTGDRLTLTPSKASLGAIASPSVPLNAVIYGDSGFIKIHARPGQPAAVPVGEWRLLTYEIDRTGMIEPARPKPKTNAKKGSLLESIAAKAESASTGRVRPGSRHGRTIVAAEATGSFKPVKVIENATVELALGPPFKPVVTAFPMGDGQMRLQLSLVGSAGEICSNMIVDGSRPPKPRLTITDSKGKIVEQGDFEYG
ncbi:MAG: hypothetical protein ABFC96_02585 [Thermoguttaceae bacterium]